MELQQLACPNLGTVLDHGVNVSWQNDMAMQIQDVWRNLLACAKVAPSLQNSEIIPFTKIWATSHMLLLSYVQNQPKDWPGFVPDSSLRTLFGMPLGEMSFSIRTSHLLPSDDTNS